MVSKTLSSFKSILELLLSSFAKHLASFTDFLGSVSCNSSSKNSQKSRVLLSFRCLIFKVLRSRAFLSSAWLSYHIWFCLSSTFFKFFSKLFRTSFKLSSLLAWVVFQTWFTWVSSLSSAWLSYHIRFRLSSSFFKFFSSHSTRNSDLFVTRLSRNSDPFYLFELSLERSDIIPHQSPNVNAFFQVFSSFFLTTSYSGYFPLLLLERPCFFPSCAVFAGRLSPLLGYGSHKDLSFLIIYRYSFGVKESVLCAGNGQNLFWWDCGRY